MSRTLSIEFRMASSERRPPTPVDVEVDGAFGSAEEPDFFFLFFFASRSAFFRLSSSSSIDSLIASITISSSRLSKSEKVEPQTSAHPSDSNLELNNHGVQLTRVPC